MGTHAQALGVAVGLLTAAGAAARVGSSVEVNSGETLTAPDLVAGVFLGQGFTLGPSTEFNINSGGAIGPVGMFAVPPDPIVPFDFGGSTVNINAGGYFLSDPSVPSSVEDPSAVANIVLNVFAGGAVGDPMMIEGGPLFVGPGGVVTVDGGSTQHSINLLSDSTLDLLAGSVGSAIVGDGCTAEFSGGAVGFVNAIDGGVATISGATVTNSFRASGTGVVLMTDGNAGNSCRAEFGGMVMVSGGGVGLDFAVQSGSHATVSGGTVGGGFVVQDSGSTAEISAGVVSGALEVKDSAELTVSGGSIGDFSACNSSGVLHVTGGTVGANFRNGSEVNISGGSFGDGFNAFFFTTTHLFVLEASVGGVPLDLEVNETVVVTERAGALLEATLADGSFIDFALNFEGMLPGQPGVDWFDSFATVQVTRVAAPEPCTGDLNGDLVVDFDDIVFGLAHWLDPFDFDDVVDVLGNWLAACE